MTVQCCCQEGDGDEEVNLMQSGRISGRGLPLISDGWRGKMEAQSEPLGALIAEPIPTRSISLGGVSVIH